MFQGVKHYLTSTPSRFLMFSRVNKKSGTQIAKTFSTTLSNSFWRENVFVFVKKSFCDLNPWLLIGSRKNTRKNVIVLDILHCVQHCTSSFKQVQRSLKLYFVRKKFVCHMRVVIILKPYICYIHHSSKTQGA